MYNFKFIAVVITSPYFSGSAAPFQEYYEQLALSKWLMPISCITNNIIYANVINWTFLLVLCKPLTQTIALIQNKWWLNSTNENEEEMPLDNLHKSAMLICFWRAALGNLQGIPHFEAHKYTHLLKANPSYLNISASFFIEMGGDNAYFSESML